MNSSLFSLPFGRNYSKENDAVVGPGNNERGCGEGDEVAALPNFNEFLRDTFVSKPFESRDETCTPTRKSTFTWGNSFEYWEKKQMSQPYFTSSVSTSPKGHDKIPFHSAIRDEMGRTMDGLIEKLYERIQKLESDVKKQDSTISILENENQKMKEKKRKHDEILKKRDETFYFTETKRKDRKLFLVIDEFEKSQQKANNQVKNLENYTVDWNGEQFVLIDAFSNKSDIVNYYYPLYQSNNPDKVSKMVLEREEYKKLFSTNPHVKESERKRAWRITIFSIEFYEFVKRQNK